MNRFFLINKRFLRVACSLVLCAGIAVFVTMCDDDVDCKKCESKTQEGKTATFCGDDLKEAQRSDSDWKNCK